MVQIIAVYFHPKTKQKYYFNFKNIRGVTLKGLVVPSATISGVVTLVVKAVSTYCFSIMSDIGHQSCTYCYYIKSVKLIACCAYCYYIKSTIGNQSHTYCYHVKGMTWVVKVVPTAIY